MTNEEKKAYDNLIMLEYFTMEKEDKQAIETILNLVENQQKEIEALKKENLEIRDWKYTIDTIEDLDKLKELDLIKIKGKEYISKDKIKEKIERYNEWIKEGGDYVESLEEQRYALQSLLEEE